MTLLDGTELILCDALYSVINGVVAVQYNPILKTDLAVITTL
jgi:hypothetical protein